MAKLETLDITWGRAFKVWWSFTWRTFLFALGPFMILAVVDRASGNAEPSFAYWVAFGILFFAVYLLVFKSILGKQFKEYTIALVDSGEALAVTWSRVVGVFWSWCWRYILLTLLGFVVLFVVSFVVGVIAGLLGVPGVVSGALGVLISLPVMVFFGVVPFKWILGKKFKHYELVLLKNDNATKKEAA